MLKLNPLLYSDFYKCCHATQYDPDITRIVSYFTPRMTRLPERQNMVFFGLQGTIKEWLINTFNEWFFKRPLQEVIDEYNNYVGNGIGEDAYDIEKIKALHKYGKLPLRIRSLKEGSRVNIKIPMFEIANTRPEFAWLTNAVESLLSANLWHPMVVATVGDMYYDIAKKAYDRTVDNNISPMTAMCDFAFRGEEAPEAGVRASAGWLLSFKFTATIAALAYMENYYNCKASDKFAMGLPSTEHSVMCSSAAIDGDEITMIKRLLTQIYPKKNFTMVSDSYDYWNLITNLLPQCRAEIEAHEGFFGIRGDSGDPVDIVCGELNVPCFATIEMARNNIHLMPYVKGSKMCRVVDKYYTVSRAEEFTEYTPTVAELGTVEMLWNIFGGTINSKGYKVLNPKIKAVYGDGITLNRATAIYERLANKGFAANNVSLGVGSFSYQAIEVKVGGQTAYGAFTRDTFGIAIKATYCETKDGRKINIFKDPKTDKDHFKKSQKGCIIVHQLDDESFDYADGFTYDESLTDPNNALRTVFCDGEMVEETSIGEMREVLHG